MEFLKILSLKIEILGTHLCIDHSIAVWQSDECTVGILQAILFTLMSFRSCLYRPVFKSVWLELYKLQQQEEEG